MKNVFSYIPVFCVAIGALFLAASIYLNVTRSRDVPGDLKPRWRILTGMMLFFLAGYAGFFYMQVNNLLFGLEFLTGAVFLGGAFFVLLVIQLALLTIGRMQDGKNLLQLQNRQLQEEIEARFQAEKKLSEANEFLEQRVAQRTAELLEIHEELQREMAEREKNLAEIALANAELDQILDTAADGMRVVDTDYKILRTNRAFSDMVGLDAKDILGRKCFEIFKGEKCHTPDCPMDLIREKRERVEYEGEKIRPDGGKIFCIVTATPFFSPDGQLIGIVEDYRDISDRREAEKKQFETNMELSKRHSELAVVHAELKSAQSQMLQREKMASVGQLAAGVAHEINNPVGFVASNLSSLAKYVDKLVGYIDLQNRELRDDRAEFVREQRKSLKIDYIIEDLHDLIRESLEGTARVSAIVQGLKSFSRVDEAEKQQADINQCLDETLNIIWNELKYKAEVHKEYGDISMTSCYPRQLNQVFMNFLINASQAIPNKGEIKITTREKDNWISIAIADTGSGIAPKNLERIFEPFFTTKEIGKGTGLGLSISYEIIKKHGGDIEVESEVGKGTTFTIRIPVVAE
ncbi:MAG: ATP-binding protein [Pseudomonadota bacterium]